MNPIKSTPYPLRKCRTQEALCPEFSLIGLFKQPEPFLFAQQRWIEFFATDSNYNQLWLISGFYSGLTYFREFLRNYHFHKELNPCAASADS